MLGAPWSAGWEMVKHAGCAVECWVGDGETCWVRRGVLGGNA